VDISWDSDVHIPLTGIRVGNDSFRRAVERGKITDYTSADMATLKSDEIDDDPDWDGLGSGAARWPEPFRYYNLDRPGDLREF
jgi:hypothetical protein